MKPLRAGNIYSLRVKHLIFIQALETMLMIRSTISNQSGNHWYQHKVGILILELHPYAIYNSTVTHKLGSDHVTWLERVFVSHHAFCQLILKIP